MVIKMDKSQEFVKSGKKLISEYDGDGYYKEEEEKKPHVSALALVEVFRWLILQDSEVICFDYAGLPIYGVMKDCGSYRFGKTEEEAWERFSAKGRPSRPESARVEHVRKMILDALNRGD